MGALRDAPIARVWRRRRIRRGPSQIVNARGGVVKFGRFTDCSGGFHVRMDHSRVRTVERAGGRYRVGLGAGRFVE